MRLTFRHPEPRPAATRIWPVFLPFAGCPGRCVYCAQPAQTGVSPRSLETVLADLAASLGEALAAGRGPYEIGFYGGTFTSLPGTWAERFTALAQAYRARGLVTRIRCSTRPDAVAPRRLAALRELGLDLVELGIQSFDAGTLARGGRGYDPDVAVAACRTVRDSGLALGVQLLPGLPGHTPGLFARDVAVAGEMGPETARLYPCLVVRGTRLAALHAAGEYAPWSEETTLSAVAGGLLVLWRAGVRVIRVGLAPQPELAGAIVAGPAHPALGNRARALALYRLIRERATRLGPGGKGLAVPGRHAGELWGHGRELAPAYAGLGIQGRDVRLEKSGEAFTIWRLRPGAGGCADAARPTG